MATNGKASLPSARERERIEQAMDELQARLADLQARDRQIAELRDFLRKRDLLIRQDVVQIATEVMRGRPKRGNDLSPTDEPPEPLKIPHNSGKSKHKAKGKFGIALREIRQKRGLGIEDMGEWLGVSGPTLYCWETGQYKPVKTRQAEVARKLGLSEDIFK